MYYIVICVPKWPQVVTSIQFRHGFEAETFDALSSCNPKPHVHDLRLCRPIEIKDSEKSATAERFRQPQQYLHVLTKTAIPSNHIKQIEL